MTTTFAPLDVAAVLFDMDGTLVDSTAVVEKLWSEFAVSIGVNAPEVIDFAHGRPSKDTITQYVADTDERDRWFAWITEAEHTRFLECPAIAGADAFMRSLPAGTWAVVTSALAEPAAKRIVGAGLPSPVVLIGADSVRRGKPDPEGYLAGARALGVDPADCLVIEDTAAGLQAGRAAGAHVIAIGELAGDAAMGARHIADFTALKATPSHGRILIERRTH